MAEDKTPSAEASQSPGVINPEKVQARVAALVQHGTNPLIAEKIAEDAERAQLQRDAAYAKLQERKQETATEVAASLNPNSKKRGK